MTRQKNVMGTAAKAVKRLWKINSEGPLADTVTSAIMELLSTRRMWLLELLLPLTRREKTLVNRHFITAKVLSENSRGKALKAPKEGGTWRNYRRSSSIATKIKNWKIKKTLKWASGRGEKPFRGEGSLYHFLKWRGFHCSRRRNWLALFHP